MTKQMVIRIDEETKARFQRVSAWRGRRQPKRSELSRTTSGKATFHRVVDDLWERIGAKARKRGVSAGDVDRIIRETCSSR